VLLLFCFVCFFEKMSDDEETRDLVPLDSEEEEETGGKEDDDNSVGSYTAYLSFLWTDFASMMNNTGMKEKTRMKSMYQKLRGRYFLFFLMHTIMVIVTSIFVGIKSNLGILMTLGTTLNQIVPTSNWTSAFQETLNSQEQARGGYPPTLFVPLYHGVYVLYSVYFLTYGSKQFKQMTKYNYNYMKYYAHALVMSMVVLTLFVLLGFRDVIGFVFIIANVFAICHFASLVEGSVAGANIRKCEGDMCSEQCSSARLKKIIVSPEQSGGEKQEVEQQPKSKTKKKVKAPFVCTKHCIVDVVALHQKNTSMAGMSFASLFLAVALFTQTSISFAALPSWLQGLSLGLTLFFAISVVLFLSNYQRVSWKRAQKTLLFYCQEQKLMCWSTVLTVIFSATMLAEMSALYRN